MGVESVEVLLVLALVAFAAGWIDAVVGGGGLIQLPALLLVPGIAPVQALATNKLASVFGTAVSATTFYRKIRPDLSFALPAAFVALIGAAFGASIATILPREAFLPIIVLALISVLLITILKPRLGSTTSLRFNHTKQRVVALFIGVLIGFYDGVLGPGTGTFLVIALVGVIGFSFLKASAHAKIINFATNLGALLIFIPNNAVLWKLGLVMAVCNMLGGFVGSRVAIARGSRFVRIIFLIVVTALIIKLSFDLLTTIG